MCIRDRVSTQSTGSMSRRYFEGVEAVFKLFDRDGNGTIYVNDVRAIVRGVGIFVNESTLEELIEEHKLEFIPQLVNREKQMLMWGTFKKMIESLIKKERDSPHSRDVTASLKYLESKKCNDLLILKGMMHSMGEQLSEEELSLFQTLCTKSKVKTLDDLTAKIVQHV
eukprot:TRINITY_DN17824_c0_g1_i1.p1 TRINITY_DN17824_c0_g1~~TRINITY_DN17824_c0_g1_i1.p1  ORF type:complete len:168 (-),score=23.45 TRINITY_DN17824_c0_g1_i1:52-555(-)